jgi:cholest-4-en-3-one 26-monooxygenase
MALSLADVNLIDKDVFTKHVPFEWFDLLRRDAPLFWQEGNDNQPGFWVVTRHSDVVAINRDWETFSSYEQGTLLEPVAEEQLEHLRLIMLNMDPPRHTKLRMLVKQGFTPRHIGELEQHIRDIATNIIDTVCEKGSCDFVTEISAELPLQVIAEMLGVPHDDRHRVFEWSNRLVGNSDPEYSTSPEQAQEASAELFFYANALAAAKRENPRDDIVTALLQAEVDGEQLTEMEFDSFFLLLSVAGNETTRNLISLAMLALFDNPDQWRVLVEDPSKIDWAVEEMLRWGSPVMYFKRTATRDKELHGQTIAAGDPVSIWYIAANRDDTVFADPYRFDVQRPDAKEQIAFGGGGPHHCLGHNLARMEIRVIFEELARRLPDITLAGEPRRLRSNFINGIKEIPVSFTPSAPLGSS